MASQHVAAHRLGKEAEAYVWLRLLQNDFTPYLPLIDVDGVDALVEKPGGGFQKLQIKSRGFDGSSPPEYGQQIKDLRRGDSLPFDYLIIALPKENAKNTDLEAWTVPANVVTAKLSKGGDLTMSHRLMRKEWQEYYENWDSLSAL